jgi:hypothetical protein
MDQELQQNILKKLGIESLPENERDETLALMLDAIIKQAVIIAHDTLPDDKKERFVSLVENGGDLAELIEYFSGTVDGKTILEKAVEEVLEETQKIEGE